MYICHLGFFTRKQLYNHKEAQCIEHPDHICELCGKISKTAALAKIHHRNIHTDYKPVLEQCPFCKAWYTGKRNLRQHILNVHESQGKEHRCNICNQLSSSPQGLRAHIYIYHKSEDKYKCKLCGKGFRTAFTLREHMAKHTGEALYACPHCPTTFAHATGVYKHIKALHKTEYALFKEQGQRRNLIGIAKKASEKFHPKKLLTDTSVGCTNNSEIATTSTETNSSLLK